MKDTQNNSGTTDGRRICEPDAMLATVTRQKVDRGYLAKGTANVNVNGTINPTHLGTRAKEVKWDQNKDQMTDRWKARRTYNQ